MGFDQYFVFFNFSWLQILTEAFPKTWTLGAILRIGPGYNLTNDINLQKSDESIYLPFIPQVNFLQSPRWVGGKLLYIGVS